MEKSPAQHSTLEVAIYDSSQALQYAQFTSPIEERTPQGLKKTERKIFSLHTTTFWLSLALSVVDLLAIVAAIIGVVFVLKHSTQKATDGLDTTSNSTASIASGISSESSISIPSRTSSGSLSTSTSNTTPLPSSTTTSIPSNECPATNNTDFTAPLTNSIFHITCGVDWTNGTESAYSSGIVQDLVGIYSNSMEQCIDGCPSYNHNQGPGSLYKAVSYTANLSEFWVGRQHANCFLKNKAGFGHFSDPVTLAELFSL